MRRILLLSLFSILACASYGQVISDFSVDNESWTIFNTSSGASVAASYNSTGGNPGGYISDPGTTTGPTIFYAEAPAKFKGNLSTAYSQNLSFDLKQSTAGTDNSYGDLIIQNASSGITLYYQLPTKPAVASFTSYIVQLNEGFTGWHVGSTSGAAPTQTQMKIVLGNITLFRIRLKYTTSNTFNVTGSLDNFVLNLSSIPTPPTIFSFSPASGLPGTSITIAGSNFNAATAQNAVYFNGVRGTVVTATTNQLTVTSPPDISFGPITVTNLANGTQATTSSNFNPLFDNNKDFGGRVIPATFDPKVDFGTTTEVGFSIGDLDGDGWMDVLTSGNSLKASVFRNLKQTGAINSSSFAAPLILTMPNGLLSGNPGPVSRVGQNSIADIDGDGKLDLIINAGYNQGGNYDNSIIVFLNQSSPGNLAFSAGSVFQFNTINNNNQAMTIADIDGDGRPDFMGALNNSACALGIAQNLSTPGNVDFAAVQNFGLGATLGADISVGDLTGDGKPEILVEAYLGGSIKIYENLSTPGTFSLANPFQVSTSTTTNIKVVDLDLDGLGDLCFKDNTGALRIKKNNHVTGALSAADFSADVLPPSLYPTGSGGGTYIGVADVNGDNKPDLLTNDGTNVVVYQNNYFPGPLTATSFMPGIAFEGAGTSNSFLSAADINGDNKPDILIKPSSGANFRVYQNESFPAPQVVLLAPPSGYVGTPLTMTGLFFNTFLTNPQIRVNGIVGTGSGLTNGSVNVAAPTGISDTKAVISLHGLQGFSKPFTSTFPGNGVINASSFLPGVDLPLANNSGVGGLAVADFNDDGKADIAADDNSTGKIYQNVLAAPGNAITVSGFTLLGSTLSTSQRLTAGDFDGDGKIDIATAGSSLFRNVSSGAPSFSASVSSNMNSAISILADHDFNLDGKPDLASTSGNNLYVYENLTRAGAFTTGSFPSFSGNGFLTALSLPFSGIISGLSAQDFDGDGFDDIAIGLTSTTSSLSVYRNLGIKLPISTGQFASPIDFTSLSSPKQIVAADFDGDGKMDVAMGYGVGSSISVFQNQSTPGSLSFAARQDIATGSGFVSIDARDLDGDGRPEIVTINFSGTGSFSVYKNTSAGTISFAAPVTVSLPAGRTPTNLAIADLNLDGQQDIIIRGNGSPNFITVFQNNVPLITISITAQPSDVTTCAGSTATFSAAATGTSNITYQWQYSSTGSGGPFNDVVNGGAYSNATTSTLSVNTTGNVGAGRYRCKISGDIAATVYTIDKGLLITACTNQAPVIQTTDATTQPNGSVTINLVPLLSDADNNIDLLSLKIIVPPTSGASASINTSSVLSIDYSGVSFSGTDQITIGVCDLLGACTQQVLTIEVIGDLVIYTGISPNGDGKNDIWIIRYIDSIDATKNNTVKIFNRWGDVVFETENYNNNDRVFRGLNKSGDALPTGNYFYKIEFQSGRPTATGYISLKR